MDSKELIKYIRILREKANNNKLIVFVGAGVSCNVEGMPSWNDLINKMADSISYSKCSTCKMKHAKCKDTCKFIKSFSTDEFLKIPQYVYNTNRKKYERILLDNIKHERGIDAPLSNAIFDLAPSHIITTNYDKLLEDCKSAQRDNYDVIVNDKDLLNSEKNKYIIKMHGDITDLNTIVLKESDYLEYTQKHVLIEMFVKSLLTDHTILFVGYSLNDYNIKLIVSWINYIRLQNNALDSKTKFGYMVFDDKKITQTQKKYFEKNNIGIINLYNMPLIDDVPNELKNAIGKRLYSFLETIKDANHEGILGEKLSYKESIYFMKNYSYIDCKNICSLLYISKYVINGHELIVYSDSDYDSLKSYLEQTDDDALYLKNAFYDAGIYYVSKISSSKQYFKISDCHNRIFDNKFFDRYINNDYCALDKMNNSMPNNNLFESCFYATLVRGYTEEVFDWHNQFIYSDLSVEQKVRYIFNSSVLESQKTYGFNGYKIDKYINGISDAKQKKMFQFYKDVLDGNDYKMNAIKQSLEKLKERYYNSNISFFGNSLEELYKIKRIVIEQYLFYFNNTLFFRGFSDLRKLLKVYIEAIVCTNGTFVQSTHSALSIGSVRERYTIDAIDFDVLTKFISIKDLYKMIEEYKLEKFSVDESFVDYVIGCFKNIANSMIQLNLYHRLMDAPNILINCMIFLLYVPLNEVQKNKVSEVICQLMKNNSFIQFFFSTNIPERSLSTRVINDLLKILPKQHDFEIVKSIILNPEFKDYYFNINVRRLQGILSAFIDNTELSEVQDEINAFVSSFEGKEKIIAIRLLHKHIVNLYYKTEYKEFIAENINMLSSDDILEFIFNDMLEISPLHEQKLLNDAINIYHQQKNSNVHSFPDPLIDKLDLICILYIEGKIKNLDALKELMDENDFLKFFLDSENFDYSKVDFSNYMWQNVAQYPRFMDRFIENKEAIIPSIQHRINIDTASEFERKVLYGYLLDRPQLF